MITITGNILSDTTTHVHLKKVMDVTLTGNTFFTTEPTDLLIEESARVTVTGNAFNPREAKSVGGIGWCKLSSKHRRRQMSCLVTQ